MSDARLREAQRAYREGGNPEDEALYLREASRAGALSEDRVHQASDLGYLPARLALGIEPLEDEEIEGLGSLLRNRWGQWLLVRASLPLTRALRPAEAFASGQGLVAAEVLRGIEAWEATPESPQAWALRPHLADLRDDAFQAWAGERFAGALLHTLWAVVRPPPRGSWSTQGYLAPWHALQGLGRVRFDALVAAEVVPGLIALGLK